jgi:agmatine deiminase
MTHPKTAFFRHLTVLRSCARALGYRMPAEWEPMRRVWLSPPQNPATWPHCFAQARAQFRGFAQALRRQVTVASTTIAGIPTNDAWVRDFGPIFVVRDPAVDHGDDLPRKALHDFRFNGWGGKYERRGLDDLVPQHIAARLGLPLWVHNLVFEGGSIDVNGRGTVMTTEQCLLHKNRNPRKKRGQIVAELHEALGTRHVIWLPGGIVGDDTDGHIDDIARFVTPGTIVAVRARRGHPDQAMLERNWRALRQARDQDGHPLTLVALPAPEPILYRFPADRYRPGGLAPLPASYANFLIVNGAVFVPIFGQDTDEKALHILGQALPRYRIVGLRAEHLVVGLGAFHCLSQQEPE